MKTLKAAKEKTAAAVFATLALCTGFYLVSVCQAGPSFWADPRDKKIIEIGWDALPAAQLLNELPNRQNTSFDGMAFLVPLAGEPDSSICVFDTVQHSPDAYGFDVLQNISKSWGRYTDNLIWVFANHSKSNRDFDWFDDSQWDRIEANAKNLSKCIKISGAKGIALDPEFYYGVNPWQYSADKFSGKTFDQVSQTVRVRGRQYMRGLQSVKSDVVLYGLELIFGSSRNPNPEGNELALLLPFALGMLDEANPGTVLMDASQVNYHLASTAGASYYYDQIRNVVRSNCIPSDLRDKFDRQYLAAYGLCMDLCYAQGSLAGHTNLSADQQDDFWRNNLYYALRNTDRYVSVYTQFKNTVDQRLNWYTGDFIPANAKAIMSEVRTKINANQSLGFSLNTPEVKIMAPSVSWTAGSNQVAAQASAVFSYQNAPGVSHSDLYLDGLYAGTFNGGTVSINASLMSPGKHQLVLRSFSNGGAETFNDSDILLVDATITKSPAIANTAYSSSIAGSGSNAYGLPITYEKLSGPSWLSVASDGTLSGTPQTSDSGANLWIVRARNGYGGSDISSLSVMVYPTNNYGTLTGNSTSSGYINRVQLSNLDNTSGNNNGYADFRGLIANLVPGQSVNYTLTPGGNSIFTTMAWTIWIDFNRDGSFSDAERIVTTSASSFATSGSFTVPATATAGPSRMRIAMKRSSTAQTSPTDTFSSGEVEDYSVQIGAGTVPNAVPYFLSAPTTKTDLPAGSPITGSLASNAADWEIDGLTFSKTSGPAWLAIAPDGTLSGIPPASARGLNSFVVGIADSAGGTNAGTLQVNVINNAPLPVSQNVNTAWRKPVSINLTGTDADGDALTFAIDSQPGSGVLSGTAPALTYTPGELFSGTDSFTFHVSDGFVNGLIENYNFDLPASPGYYGAEAPDPVDQGGIGWTFDTAGGNAGVANAGSYWVPPGGTSPTGGNFAYIAYGGGAFQNISPGEGLITVSFYAVGSTGNPASTNIDISVGGTALKFSGSSVSIGNTAWTFYTSDPVNVGAGSQNLIFGRINNVGSGNAQGGVFIDGVSIMRHGTVNIAVGRQNSTPVPISQNVSTAWRTPILINLTGTDADGDTLAFAVDSLPAGGLLSGTAPTLTYTPGATFSGTDSFTFHVSDGFEYGLIANYNFELPASPGYYGAEAPGIVDQGGGWTFDNTGGSAGVAAPASYWAPPGGSSPDGGNFAYIAYGGGVFQNISPGEGLITVSFYAVGSTGNPASTNIDISVGGTALKFSGSSVSIGNTAWKLYTSDPINVGAGSQNLIFGRINNAGGGNAQGGVFIDGVTITRYGTVTIVVGPAPYDAWKQTNFTTQQLAQSSVSGDLSDPDHDGVPNLIEYGLGTDPNKTSMIGLPTLSTTGDYLSLTFTRQKWAADITYRIEATGDLTSSWTEIWSSSSVPYGGGNNASESVTVQDSVSVSSASTHRRFMRLKITKP